jgi:hypothetical protein
MSIIAGLSALKINAAAANLSNRGLLVYSRLGSDQLQPHPCDDNGRLAVAGSMVTSNDGTAR